MSSEPPSESSHTPHIVVAKGTLSSPHTQHGRWKPIRQPKLLHPNRLVFSTLLDSPQRSRSATLMAQVPDSLSSTTALIRWWWAAQTPMPRTIGCGLDCCSLQCGTVQHEPKSGVAGAALLAGAGLLAGASLLTGSLLAGGLLAPGAARTAGATVRAARAGALGAGVLESAGADASSRCVTCCCCCFSALEGSFAGGATTGKVRGELELLAALALADGLRRFAAICSRACSAK